MPASRLAGLARRPAAALAGVGATFCVALILAMASLRARLAPADPRDRERGDVPGWVLITLMTAGLVTALWAVAAPQLKEIFTTAISSVKGP